MAFKLATTELKSNMDNPTLRGKRGYGVISMAKKYYSTLLSSPKDRRIKESMLHEAVAADRIGISHQGHIQNEELPLRRLF